MSHEPTENHDPTPIPPTPPVPHARTWLDEARRLGPASYLAVGAAVLPPLGSIILFANINRIGDWLRADGHNGVAVYIAGFAFFAGVALLPTYSSAILGGWAFGGLANRVS